MRNTTKRGVFAGIAMVFLAGAAAADTRTGTITEITSSDTGKVFVKLDHGSSNICGNNGANGNAYVNDYSSWFEAHKSILIAAFLAGRSVVLEMDDTGSECRINKVTMTN